MRRVRAKNIIGIPNGAIIEIHDDAVKKMQNDIEEIEESNNSEPTYRPPKEKEKGNSPDTREIAVALFEERLGDSTKINALLERQKNVVLEQPLVKLEPPKRPRK